MVETRSYIILNKNIQNNIIEVVYKVDYSIALHLVLYVKTSCIICCVSNLAIINCNIVIHV